MKKLLKMGLVLLGVSFSLGALAASTEVRSLENMERERAALLAIILDSSLTPVQREQRIVNSSRQLVNLERMVMRDNRLLGSGTPIVRKAFSHYDTSFLIHTSIEQRRHVIDHWFKQFSLHRDAVLNSHSGKR